MIDPSRATFIAFASFGLVLTTPVQAGPDLPETAQVRAEEVRIESEPGVVLAGELRLPPAAGKQPPVVLLLGGGGPSPRGIYPLLEGRLLADGIATLSFDKRGVGQSTGTFADAMEPQQRDARAALAYLRSRSEVIDVSRVAVLGLSQGGVIGPALAVEAPPVAAIVILAAPAGERGDTFLNEMRVKLTASGMNSQASEQVIDATRRYLDALTTSAAAETVAVNRGALIESFIAAGWTSDQANGAVGTLSDPTTSSLYTVAPGAVLAQVDAPVLALYAEDDTVVSSELNVPLARQALREHRDATVAMMPNVEHGFKPLVSEESGKREYQGWPISDPATLNMIDDWLSQRLKD